VSRDNVSLTARLTKLSARFRKIVNAGRRNLEFSSKSKPTSVDLSRSSCKTVDGYPPEDWVIDAYTDSLFFSVEEAADEIRTLLRSSRRRKNSVARRFALSFGSQFSRETANDKGRRTLARTQSHPQKQTRILFCFRNLFRSLPDSRDSREIRSLRHLRARFKGSVPFPFP